ncbi:MAG: polysulfide reductase NrfD [Firmicutes bacterium]|nr:polysulfide reductase NrfD [Bacillota bacterium]
MAKYYFAPVKAKGAKYYWVMGILGALTLGWLIASYIRFIGGPYLTGLNHQVTWAGPKVVFVLFVGLSAGSFIISALSAVFGQKEYKVLSRVGGFLAVLFILAALLLLITDWGRPDRLFIVFDPNNINPTSMLSLNAFFYTTYMVIGIFYLWAQFKEHDRAMTGLAIAATVAAVFVHTGTGFIFAIANAREMLFTPVVPIAFVVAALSSGSGMIMNVLYFTFKLTGRSVDVRFFRQLSKVMLGLIIVVIYLMAVEHLMHLYVPEHREGELFVLFGEHGGQFFQWAFWGGLITIGGIVPVFLLLYKRTKDNLKWILTAGGLHVFGVLCERMLIILPGQMLPISILPGYQISSAFGDGKIWNYLPSGYEWMQLIGIFAFVAFVYILGLRMLPLLPVEGRYVSEGKPKVTELDEIVEAELVGSR